MPRRASKTFSQSPVKKRVRLELSELIMLPLPVNRPSAGRRGRLQGRQRQFGLPRRVFQPRGTEESHHCSSISTLVSSSGRSQVRKIEEFGGKSLLVRTFVGIIRLGGASECVGAVSLSKWREPIREELVC